jgi:pilus assembly protein FimV
MAFACALVASLPVHALGLGQIQVRSQAGQPLLAEIPIISSDRSELDNLQARLASPETFRRIGLQPPQGIVSDLQFRIALDARGNPVVRVTSAAPVQQPLLTFLIEVDWGQGRLVREYSALLDAPRTVSAPAQPPIQAPAVAPPNVITRPAPAPVLAEEPPPSAPRVSNQVTPAPVQPRAAPAPAPQPAIVTPAEYGPVQAGDTLGRIAARLAPKGYTRDQTMLALLRANPGAFIDGNINLVRQGAVLRMPEEGALSRHTAAEARALVREQISQWRDMQRPDPVPDASTVATAAATGAKSPGTDGAGRSADARLEITPPSAGGGQKAGTRSGIAAGGEGEMLRQEMQQAQETLAARTAEVEELKARVAELEQLQKQQQQLISLKDSELAAAQQRLGESNQRPATTLAEANAATGEASSAAAAAGGVNWMWLGMALLLAAAVSAWLVARRRPAPTRARGFDAAALAAGMAPDRADVEESVAGDAPRDVAATPAFTADLPAGGGDPGAGAGVTDEAGEGWDRTHAPADEPVAPTWHSGAGRAGASEDAATVVPLNPSPAGQERIELARAYIDLGDIDTARSLLQEVAAEGDADARDEAARLLRSLA